MSSTSLNNLLKNLKGGFSRRRSRRRGGVGLRRGGSKMAHVAAPVHNTTMRKGGVGLRRGGVGLRRGGGAGLRR